MLTLEDDGRSHDFLPFPNYPRNNGGGNAFILQHTLPAAKAVIKEAEHVQLSERDSLQVLDLLENPPAPNAKLRAASKVLPRQS